MKKILATFALAASFAVSIQAASTTNLLDLQSVNGTNAGLTVSAAGVTMPLRTFIFQSGPITNVYGGSWTTNGVTNAITRYWQASFDAANWVNLYTNAPANTNATVEQITPAQIQKTIYYRVIVVTTNPLPAATFMQQN